MKEQEITNDMIGALLIDYENHNAGIIKKILNVIGERKHHRIYYIQVYWIRERKDRHDFNRITNHTYIAAGNIERIEEEDNNGIFRFNNKYKHKGMYKTIIEADWIL